MSTVSVSLPSDGETADVADYNTPITTIVDEINGNLDNSNIKSGAAIDGSKLASGTVDTAQLAPGAVETDTLAQSAVDASKLAGDTVNLIDGNLTLHNVPIKQVSSDSVEDNVLIQGGWGYVLGSGSTQTVTTVTLPETLDSTPFVVLISSLGYKSGSNPTSINDFSTDDRVIVRARCSTTTISVSFIDKDATNMSSSVRFGFSWLVVGTKAT